MNPGMFDLYVAEKLTSLRAEAQGAGFEKALYGGNESPNDFFKHNMLLFREALEVLGSRIKSQYQKVVGLSQCDCGSVDETARCSTC